MEGHLRRLGRDAEQDQHEDRQQERVGAHLLTGGEHLAERKAAHHGAEQQKAGEQREAPARGHEQRGTGTPARLRGGGIVADQQERQQVGQFPEEQEQQEVVSRDQTEHRGLEGQH